MSVLALFGDNLKPVDVLVFNSDGTIVVMINNKLETLKMQVSPTGCLTARPIEKLSRDQPQERRTISREQRLAMTDQGQAILAQERGG